MLVLIGQLTPEIVIAKDLSNTDGSQYLAIYIYSYDWSGWIPEELEAE
jgi:hypothetical protein